MIDPLNTRNGQFLLGSLRRIADALELIAQRLDGARGVVNLDADRENADWPKRKEGHHGE